MSDYLLMLTLGLAFMICGAFFANTDSFSFILLGLTLGWGGAGIAAISLMQAFDKLEKRNEPR